MTRMRRCLSRWRSMTTPERLLVARAAATVLVVRLGLSTFSARRIIRATIRLQQRAVRGTRAPAGSPDQVASVVRRVSRKVPGATCLTQAIATQLLLARSGCASTLRIGVGHDPAGAFSAHAWVELDGRVIIGGNGLERYVPMPPLDAPA